MKKHHKLILVVSLLGLCSMPAFAQLTISPAKGYDHDIGNMISMLEDLRARIIRNTEGLNQSQTDFLLDEKANRIGAMIMHLAATEVYYQAFTFEGRAFNEEEKSKWQTALYLGEDARREFVGKPISYYLQAWTEVRSNTKKLLKTKDDDWFSSKIQGEQVNNQWAWFHVMEHQANHMGQINMLRSRFPE